MLFIILHSCDTYPDAFSNARNSESQEFSELMKLDAIDRRSRSAAAINHFVNDSGNSATAALLIENDTNCDIILRIKGNQSYRLPIPKKGKNYLVVPKGTYSFQSKFCNSRYNTSKIIDESLTIKLSETYLQ